MGETADQTARELSELRAQMSSKVTSLRSDAAVTAQAATPLLVAVAGLGAVVVGSVLFLRHRHKADAKRLVGTLKRLAETLEARPDIALGTLGSMPADALREVIERKPSSGKGGAGSRVVEVAVRSAVTTAVGFALSELKDRLLSPASANGAAPAPAKTPARGRGRH